MTTDIAKKLEYILSGTGTSKEEFNEIIDLMEEYSQGQTLPLDSVVVPDNYVPFTKTEEFNKNLGEFLNGNER